MNITTIVDTISEAIAQDSDIATWCQTNYGGGQTVYVNIDERNLPGASGCPYIALWPASKHVGRAVIKKNHVVEIACCIHDDNSRTHGEIDNIVEFTGVANIEALRKLIETSVAEIDFGKPYLADVDIEYDTITSFPFFYAGMMITIIETVVIGGDHLS